MQARCDHYPECDHTDDHERDLPRTRVGRLLVSSPAMPMTMTHVEILLGSEVSHRDVIASTTCDQNARENSSVPIQAAARTTSSGGRISLSLHFVVPVDRSRADCIPH